MKYKLLIISLFVSMIGFSQSNTFIKVRNDSAFFAWVINPGDTLLFHVTDVPFSFFQKKVVVVPINATASANLVLTDQPNSEQPLANSQRSGVRINTEGYTQFRVTAVVMANSASANSPRIYLQYSTDAVNWIGNGSTGSISLATTGAKETAWINIPSGAIGDIYVRVAQNGGNGTADPALGTVTIQLK